MIRISDNAATVLEKRYLNEAEDGTRESAEDLFHRVANNISLAERRYDADEATRVQWEARFFDVMSRLEFVPNSPTLMRSREREITSIY